MLPAREADEYLQRSLISCRLALRLGNAVTPLEKLRDFDGTDDVDLQKWRVHVSALVPDPLLSSTRTRVRHHKGRFGRVGAAFITELVFFFFDCR